MAELMGIYFVCEKVAKHLTRNEVSDKRLYLQMVKKWIKANGIIVSEYDVDLIFIKQASKNRSIVSLYNLKY